MIEFTPSREHVSSISLGLHSLSMLSIYLISVKQNNAERERERERIKEEVLDDVLILYTHREYILQMCMYIHTHIENQRLVIHSVLVSSSIHQLSNPLGS